MLKHVKIIVSAALLAAAGLAVFSAMPKRQQADTASSQAAAADGSLRDFYNQARQLAQVSTDTATSSSVTFLAAGDIMLSRDVAAATIKSGNINYPFAGVANLLKSTDFNFANLESPVAAPGAAPIVGGESLTFGAPGGSLAALKTYGFRAVNLANNHAFDQGVSGLEYTRTVLDNFGIVHEGTGDNLNQAWAPAAVTSSGIKICFVGAAYGTNTGGSEAARHVAETGEAGMLKQAVTTAKAECDFVVATMHAGVEYTRTPNDDQTAFAHAAIDDGADMVIGAHPHWIQPMEKYDGRYIFYSLGNFIFDQSFSPEVTEGLVLKITINKPAGAELQGSPQTAALSSLELIPVIIRNSQPRPANAAEAKNILNKIGISQNILN